MLHVILFVNLLKMNYLWKIFKNSTST